MAQKKTEAKPAPQKRAKAKLIEEQVETKPVEVAPAEEEAAEEEESEQEPPKKSKGKRIARALTEVAKRRLVRALIRQAAERLEQEAGKTTMGDLIRLLNLEKELGREKPTKITVQWIDPRTGKPWVTKD